MTKIINLQNNIRVLEFHSPRHHFDLYWKSFEGSELGKIYQQIPWDALVSSFKIRRKDRRGRKPLFSLRSKIALMFLKSYTKLSDKALFERLHSDIHFQFFCNIYISPEQRIKDYKAISAIRKELAATADWDGFQTQLTSFWKPAMDMTQLMMMDATCYETYMRYPTDQKLLWESVEWLYRHIKKMSKAMKEPVPRSKFGEQKNKYLSFEKKRRKTHKERIRLSRSLLYLGNKLYGQMDQVLELANEQGVKVGAQFTRRSEVIGVVLSQQQALMQGEQVKDRIVSIDKSYIRPIVRGKETKRVEFGAKVNMIQVDGINIIQKISFNAFNEGQEFIASIGLSRKLFGKCRQVAADAIYATNKNRKYASRHGVATSFVRKGKAGKNEEQRKSMQKILSTARATRMEGSFGNEKNKYGLDRIRARTELTEVLWIYFGVHTANASKMAVKKENHSAKTA